MHFTESSVWSEYCSRVFGADLKQTGMVTIAELELLYQEVTLPLNSHILDMGCGAGYISSALSEKYQSSVKGIDIDEKRIGCAKRDFSNNNMLDFSISDFNEAQYNEATFDMICFFDTLYFTETVEKLRLLLDKCLYWLKPGGKIVVYWSNYFKYNMPDMPDTFPNLGENFSIIGEPAVNKTQVGIWGESKSITVKAFDLTTQHRQFWINALKVSLELNDKALKELPEWKWTVWENDIMAKMCDKGDNGGIYRWLYVFTKYS